jgi:hypothetical protein
MSLYLKIQIRRPRIMIMIIVLGFSNIELMNMEEFSHMTISIIKEKIKRMVFVMVWT